MSGFLTNHGLVVLTSSIMIHYDENDIIICMLLQIAWKQVMVFLCMCLNVAMDDLNA